MGLMIYDEDLRRISARSGGFLLYVEEFNLFLNSVYAHHSVTLGKLLLLHLIEEVGVWSLPFCDLIASPSGFCPSFLQDSISISRCKCTRKMFVLPLR